MNWYSRYGFGVRDIFSAPAWTAALAEFLGTFMFVYLGCGSVISSGTLLDPQALSSSRLLVIAIAHGLAIAVLVSATAGISGGHLNPAVTFAFVTTGGMSLVRGIMYWIAQFGGGILAAGLLRDLIPSILQGGLGSHSVNSAFKVYDAFAMEVILTCVLVFVVFSTAVDGRGPSGIAPLAIGFAVLVDHLVGVPITGASMNPARSLGPALWSGEWRNHWIYWAGPLLGAAGASIVYKAVFLPSPKLPQPLKGDLVVADMSHEYV